MCQRLLGDAAFYRLLLRFDEDLAAAERPLGCRVCAGRLEVGDFRRKPRGVAFKLGERFAERLSFCCAQRDCRKRRTPASVRFLGRKVYLAALVVLISAMRCGPTPLRLRRLHEWVGVSRHTVARWRRWWSEELPSTPLWRALAGTWMPPVAGADLPASLLERLPGAPAERVAAILRALAPLTVGSPAEHAT
jgi:hypothetical protein